MREGKTALAALAAVAIAGCDGTSGDAPVREITASTAYVDQLKALSETNQGLALRRAIQDSGERCKRIETSGYQQDHRNLSMWTARCSDTGDWALFIAPNGDVQVRDCDNAATLELPACRFDEAAS